MYDYDYYTYTSGSDGWIGTVTMISTIMWLIIMAVCIFQIICIWKIYKKAGKKGWECIIPIYSNIVLLEIVDLPLWYIVLFFIPFANIYVIFKIYIELAHKFNKSTGFGIGLIFLPVIFLAILAFEKNSEISPIANENLTATASNKFCPKCGSIVDADSDFCANCGSKVE